MVIIGYNQCDRKNVIAQEDYGHNRKKERFQVEVQGLLD